MVVSLEYLLGRPLTIVYFYRRFESQEIHLRQSMPFFKKNNGQILLKIITPVHGNYYNSLIPYIKIHILLTVLHTFLR